MFWRRKNKDKKPEKPQTPADIRAQALANVRAARAHIGEETLDKIAEAMTAKQRSATEQAKQQIQAADPDRVLDELLLMMKEREQY